MAFMLPSPTLLPGVNKHLEIIGGWPGENVKGFDLWFLKHWRVFWSCWFWTTKLKIAWEKVCFFSYPVTCVDHRGLSGHPQGRWQYLTWRMKWRGPLWRKRYPGLHCCWGGKGLPGSLRTFFFSIESVSQDSGKGDTVFFAKKRFLTPTVSLSSTRVMYRRNTVKILRWVKEPLPCVFVNKHFLSVQDAYKKISLLCISAFNFVKHIHMYSEALCFPPF